jgi:hypothetical protein
MIQPAFEKITISSKTLNHKDYMVIQIFNPKRDSKQRNCQGVFESRFESAAKVPYK